MRNIFHKYSCIFEDIVIDLLNNTFLRNGLSLDYADLDSSITLLNENKKSIIRWGDGEAFILLKRDLYFHEYSPQLKTRLLEIIRNYNDGSPYYLCLPAEFLTCSVVSLRSKKRGPVSFYQMHKGTRYVFKRYFNKESVYLSHFVFKGDTQNHFNRLLKIISKFKALIVVKEYPSIVNEFMNKFIGDVDYEIVKIPGKNAFRLYDKILHEIMEKVNRLNCLPEDILILISAGPCAKVLTFDLSNNGYIAYDIGKFIECWLDNVNIRN